MVEDDGARFEERHLALLEDRDLAEGLGREVVLRALILGTDQLHFVRNARLLERPPHAEIPHEALSERRDPLETQRS